MNISCEMCLILGWTTPATKSFHREEEPDLIHFRCDECFRNLCSSKYAPKKYIMLTPEEVMCHEIINS
jgi:hypothetical protein